MPCTHAGRRPVARLGVGRRPLRAEHHRGRPVRRRARLEVVERVPQHDRLLDHLERDVGQVEVRVGVAQRVQAVLHRHLHPDVARARRPAHVGADVRARSSRRPRRAAALRTAAAPRAPTSRRSPTASRTRPSAPAGGCRTSPGGRRRARSSRRREPAVWTRKIGLPTAPSAGGEVQLGHHHALEHVRGLADHDRVDVVPAEPGVVERPQCGLADEPGDRDVVPLGLVVGLPDPDDRAPVRSSRTLQHGYEVLLQRRTRRGVGDRPVGRAVHDPRRRPRRCGSARRPSAGWRPAPRPTG